MNRFRITMKPYLAAPLLLVLSATALADDAAIQHCRTLADSVRRLACYDAIPTAPGAAAPARTKPEQSFGLEQVKKHEDDKPSAIESTVVGTFDGWGPNSRIRLANGQVWRIADNSEAVLTPMQNPKVRIERNFIGTMFLHVEGSNNSAKVRRVE